jgi:hypothetical protein
MALVRDGWQDKIKDPRERKVFEALSDEKWDFRTVEGIATSTGLPKDEIRAVLMKYPDFVRVSSVKDNKNRTLYTIKSKPTSIQETLAEWRSFVTKTTST